jgi:N utilization substance protein A
MPPEFLTVNTPLQNSMQKIVIGFIGEIAIGKGGQNVRLAAKLTGWKIDIKGLKSDEVTSSEINVDEAASTEDATTPEDN